MFAHIPRPNPDAETVRLRGLLEEEKAKTRETELWIKAAYDHGWKLGHEHGESDGGATPEEMKAAFSAWRAGAGRRPDDRRVILTREMDDDLLALIENAQWGVAGD